VVAESDEAAPAESDSAGAARVEFATAAVQPPAVVAATGLPVVSQLHVAVAVVVADPVAERVAPPIGPAPARPHLSAIRMPDSHQMSDLFVAAAIPASADARCDLHELPVWRGQPSVARAPARRRCSMAALPAPEPPYADPRFAGSVFSPELRGARRVSCGPDPG